MLRPLPYHEPERLVILDETALKRGIPSMSVSFPNFLDWRQQNKSFEDIGCYTTGGFAIGAGTGSAASGGSGTAGAGPGSSEPEQLQGGFVSQGTFELLGVAPILGRTFTAEEDQPDHDLVVILSYGLWQRRFGGDPNILGQTILLNNRPRVAIGVMPRGFQFPEVAEAWGPLALTPKTFTRTDHGLEAIGRLKPGVTLEQAQAEMISIASNIEQQNPVTNEGLSVNVIDLRASLVGDYRKALLILLGGWFCVADRLRKCSQPNARSREWSPKRDCVAGCSGQTGRSFDNCSPSASRCDQRTLGLVLALWEWIFCSRPFDRHSVG
jgi:putative ABC transport system permease protein